MWLCYQGYQTWIKTFWVLTEIVKNIENFQLIKVGIKRLVRFLMFGQTVPDLSQNSA